MDRQRADLLALAKDVTDAADRMAATDVLITAPEDTVGPPWLRAVADAMPTQGGVFFSTP